MPKTKPSRGKAGFIRRLTTALAARLTPHEQKALLFVLALFALGVAVRWLRLADLL